MGRATAFTDLIAGPRTAIAHHFTTTFSASDGAGEDAPTGALVLALLAKAPRPDLPAFIGRVDARLIWGVLFAPPTYPDPRRVMFLSPMAVAPVTEPLLAAPMPLAQPHGWLAQTLTGAPLVPPAGPATRNFPFKRPKLC